MGNGFTIQGPDNETIKAAKEAREKLRENTSILMDINTFQQKVESGEVSDDKGIAELIINGVASNYHIHINRRCVTKSDGTLITAAGLLKMYEPEELQVKYTKKPKRMLSIRQYKEMMRERRDNKSGA